MVPPPDIRNCPVRADIESMISDIKQSMELLRRHL
jgi:hypothetical protein